MRKILFLAAAINFALAQMFINDMKVDLLDENSKQIVGEIYEGTPVNLIKNVGEFALIEVSGEVANDNEKILAYKKDPLITYLALKNSQAKPKMRFLIDAKKLNDNGIEAWEEIELAYYDSCSSCHAAHKPKEHLMSEWEAYLTAMQTFAKIDDDEKARILRFMQAFAKDGILKE